MTEDAVDMQAGTDALLVVRAQLGERPALHELVNRWHEPVSRYVRSMVGRSGAAQDVSQEAWAAALRALPRLEQPERFRPWLFTIVRRAVLNHLRDRYAEPAAAESTDAGSADEVAAVLDRAQVAEGLAAMPAAERDVLTLFYLQDLALEECAQVLAVPVGTVKSRLHRARRMMRDQLVRKGYTHD
ncbi:sigma-70 family RNA polymerase sigma factor [Actinoplanes sp. NPDC049548]|uniref:RNA polymerase sigma factor n=1 Tax=Actinoplanes sp. NPDC049548 TaxID=3155152 RepID=UPI00343B4227